MKHSVLLIALSILLIAASAFGEEEKKIWSGTGEAGLLMTTGNSETDSVNAKAGLKYEKGHLLAEVGAAALYSSEETEIDGEKEDKVSAEKYNYNAKLGYKFDPVNYVFVNGDYEDDRFSGYDYRTTYSVGYGRKVIDNDTVKFDIEIGPGYRYDRLEGGETEDEAIVRGWTMFNYKFSDAVSFQQDLTVIAGSDNTNTKSVSALKTQIIGALSMKMSYTVDHNSTVPADKDKTDTETALTLVYDF
jgi:putative salt-induced outer membrane protein